MRIKCASLVEANYQLEMMWWCLSWGTESIQTLLSELAYIPLVFPSLFSVSLGAKWYGKFLFKRNTLSQIYTYTYVLLADALILNDLHMSRLSKQLRDKGFAQGPHSCNLVVLGFELTTLWSLVQIYRYINTDIFSNKQIQTHMQIVAPYIFCI